MPRCHVSPHRHHFPSGKQMEGGSRDSSARNLLEGLRVDHEPGSNRVSIQFPYLEEQMEERNAEICFLTKRLQNLEGVYEKEKADKKRTMEQLKILQDKVKTGIQQLQSLLPGATGESTDDENLGAEDITSEFYNLKTIFQQQFARMEKEIKQSSQQVKELSLKCETLSEIVENLPSAPDPPMTNVEEIDVVAAPSQVINLHRIKREPGQLFELSRKRHSRDVTKRHIKDRFYCTCSHSFKTREKLEKHIQFWSQRPSRVTLDHKCDLCAQRFPGPSHLRHHKLKYHGVKDDKPVKCRLCGESVGNRRLLYKHRAEQHRIVRCSQSRCGVDTAVASELGAFCKCGRRFPTLYSLNSHVAAGGTETSGTSDTLSTPRRFSCYICPHEVFSSEESLRDHWMDNHY